MICWQVINLYLDFVSKITSHVQKLILDFVSRQEGRKAPVDCSIQVLVAKEEEEEQGSRVIEGEIGGRIRKRESIALQAYIPMRPAHLLVGAESDMH